MGAVSELCEAWRTRAADLRRYGAEPQAVVLESCAEELETRARELAAEELTLDEAGEILGVTRRTVERRIDRGEIENVGRPGEPRVRRGDIISGGPRLVTGEPDVAEELLRDRY